MGAITDAFDSAVDTTASKSAGAQSSQSSDGGLVGAFDSGASLSANQVDKSSPKYSDARNAVASAVAKKLLLNHPSVGTLEAGANMLTGMIAKPLSDIGGLAATGYEMATGGNNPDGPTGFKKYIQDSLTYEPRGTTGKAIAEYNPLALIGKGYGLIGKEAGDAIKGDGSSPVRQAIGDGVAELIPQAVNVLGAKAGGIIKTRGNIPVSDILKDSPATPTPPRIEPTLYKPRYTSKIVDGKAVPIDANGQPVVTPAASVDASGLSAPQLVNGAPDAAPAQYGSGGAGATNIIGRISSATPEFQADALAHIQEAKQLHGENWASHIDFDSLNKQLNADALPVPGRLTRGQASGDGAMISEEWNKRNNNGLGPLFDAQNQNQIANLKAIREQATPEVYTNSPSEHAETLINEYKNIAKSDQAPIDAQWDNIRKVSSGGMIFDAGKMLQDAQAALKEKKLTTFDPGGQLGELIDDARRGGLTADGYVNWRQNLGREAMKGGNEGKAASTIIEATNSSEMLPEAMQYRDLVNQALSDGRALHTKIEADPAYQAVVNGTSSVKDFAKKFLINGKPENVTQMKVNLAGSDVAGQTMRAAILDHLRTSAALDDQYQGNFAAKSFNKNLGNIMPIARVVMDNGQLSNLGQLGDYSSDISANPRSSWRNFSNTATELNTPSHAMAGKVGSLIGTAAESMLAASTTGASIPIIRVLKEGRAAKNAAKLAADDAAKADEYVKQSSRPSAGIINNGAGKTSIKDFP